MGKGSGGGTNTVTNNSSPPPEVMQQYRDLIAQANTAAAKPLRQYQGQMLAGFTPDQESAFQNINNAQGLGAPYLDNAQSMIQNSQTPLWNSVQQWSPNSIQQYMNPYQNDVVNATMANINETNAQQQQGVVGNAISKGAWGGDRAGIAQAELARQQGLANNQTLAGLNAGNYTQANQEFNQQQGAQLGANQANAALASQGAFAESNLGNQAFSQALQGAGAQLASGATQQQQVQSALNIPYEQFQQQQAYPYQNLSWLSSLSTGLGSGMGGTSSSTQPGPSALSQGIGTAASLGSLGYLGYLAFSDRRLKDNVTRIGNYKDYPMYSFRYKGDDKDQVGVMAQDVEKINPDAVIDRPDGYKMVNYSKLARGGAARPKGFASGGFASGDIPDISASYIPQGIGITRGSGIPSAPHLNQASNSDASMAISLLGQAAKMNRMNNKPNGLTHNAGMPEGVPLDSISFGDGSGPLPWQADTLPWLSGSGFARGGAPKGFAPGGSIWDDESVSNALDHMYGENNDSLAGMQTPAANSIPAAPQLQAQGLAPSPSPAVSHAMGNTPRGIIPPDAYQDVQKTDYSHADPINKPDPFLSLLSGIAAIGQSQSPYFSVNASHGAAEGIKNYEAQKEQAAKESYQQGNLQQQGEQLYQNILDARGKMWETGQHDAATEKLQQQELALKQRALEQGKVAVNPVTGQTYFTMGPNAGTPIPNQDTGTPAKEFADNIGIHMRPPIDGADRKKAASVIGDATDTIAPITDSILSLQRVKTLLPTIDQGKMAEASRAIQKAIGNGSTVQDAINSALPSGTPERAAYEEISKLEGNAALQNEVTNGIKGRALGFNMVKLGQNLFAGPEMSKVAQENIIDKALFTAQMAKNANEVLQPFEGHSTGSLNAVKQKYYNDSVQAGYAIPTEDYLSGAWKGKGYSAPSASQSYSPYANNAMTPENSSQPLAQKYYNDMQQPSDKTIVKTQTSPSTGKKRILYSDGTTQEIQ